MFEKKGELESLENAETIVGSSVTLKGNLKSDGNITINGKVSGDLKTKGNVTVGIGADVKANVSAKNAVISGIVQGNILIDDQLSIKETGKVYGDVQTNILSIAPGAVFTGKIIMPEEKEAEVVLPLEELEEGEEGEILGMSPSALLEVEE